MLEGPGLEGKEERVRAIFRGLCTAVAETPGCGEERGGGWSLRGMCFRWPSQLQKAIEKTRGDEARAAGLGPTGFLVGKS